MTKTGKTAVAGGGIAALAAAGAYSLYGKKGAGNRERIEVWALQLKGEVLEKIEKLKTLDQKVYYKLVDETAESYGWAKRISAYELKNVTIDLKNAWAQIGKRLR